MQINKLLLALLPLTVILSLQSCNSKTDVKSEPIGPGNPVTHDGLLTPEVLWSFGRIGEMAVSPSGKLVAYTVTWYSVKENKGNSELFVMGVDGSNKLQLTHTVGQEYNPQWIDDNTIAYLSTESGASQLWTVGADGKSARMVGGFADDINGFSLSPDGRRILFVSEVKAGKSVTDMNPDLPNTSGMIYNDLMYRHWDTWEDSLFSHVFYADFKASKIDNAVDIMKDEPYDSPMKPFSGMEEVSWSSDSRKIAYTCKKLVGKDYAFSTNSDIYLYDIETGQTKNLTEGMLGYDKQPVFSADGTKLAWVSQERAGFEADKERLLVMDLATGDKVDLTRNFDNSVSNVLWTKDSKSLYFIAGVEATYQVYTISLTDETPAAVTQGWHDYNAIALAGDNIIGNRVSIVKPAELYSIDPKTGSETEISFVNKDILGKLNMPTVKKRWIKSTDGQMVHTWIILPPSFDSTKAYPALLYCEGGPQSAVSQFWSYRWNFSIMASNGYVVVAPSRRGTLTFGQSWTDQISKNHGGQEMQDLLSAIDEVKQEPWVNENKLGAVGASYGGQTVFWLAGNHKKRFKTFIAHCGVFNAEMEYMTTEEMFFDQWENGGAPWETDNKVATHSFAQSPHKFVKNWDTPILIVHGGKDFRIPYTQGMAAFNAARMLGIPSRFLFFPDESHWVLKPQNGILWQREFKGWLDKWLK
ncbi:MAG: prolyl oligopeptidase family serine peptidase [Bacteroidales bacterium]